MTPRIYSIVTPEDISNRVRDYSDRLKHNVPIEYTSANGDIKNLLCEYLRHKKNLNTDISKKIGEIYLTVVWAIEDEKNKKMLINPNISLSSYVFITKEQRHKFYDKIRSKFKLSTPNINGYGSKPLYELCWFLYEHCISKEKKITEKKG